jgi:hypothetical protein
MRKYFGVLLASILAICVLIQIHDANAELTDQPLTGPITSPITGPLTSPTVTPTPTLIQTISSTPTPSTSSGPTATPTPTQMPLPSSFMRLGGLNLDQYCSVLGEPWDVLINGTWYCANGADPINMTAACQWQFGASDVIAHQDIPNNAYSWSCYGPQVSTTPSLTLTPTEVPTMIPTETPSLTPTVTPTEIPTPSVTETPTVTETVSSTPTITEEPDHKKEPFHFTFPHLHFSGFPFNSIHFFSHQQRAKSVEGNTCTMHVSDNKEHFHRIDLH